MFELFVLLTAVIGNVFLSLFTLLKNPKSATNRLFFMFTSTIALYLFFNYQLTHQSTDTGTLYWVKYVMSVALFINWLFYLFVVTFPKQKFRINPTVFIAGSIFTAGMLPLVGANLVFKAAKAFGGEGIPGPAMPLFLIHTVIFLGGGFVILLKKFRKSMGVEKTQMKLFLLGAVFMFISILVTNLLFILIFKTAAFVGLLPIYTLIFVSFLSYAIVKHRFLDINFLVTRAVTFVTVIAIIAILYSGAVFASSILFIKFDLPPNIQVVFIALTIVVAVSFQYIMRTIEKLTDKFLFKKRYNSNELLGKINHIMASTIRLEELTHGVLTELIHDLRSTKAAFILLEEGLVSDVKSEGFTSSPVLDESEVKFLSQTRDTLIFEELEESESKLLLRKLDLSIIIHLRTEGEQIGLLVLGSKESGDIYSEQDLNLLDILAPEAAVAIQNSKAYEEIRRFNITLQEEVDKATKDLQDANLKLQELDKLKDEFVSLASHELRTPMTAIKGSLSTILEGYAGDISKEARDFMTSAYNENDRLIRLVNNLLNISRIEAGRFTFTVTKVDMNKIITEIVHNLEIAAKEKNLFFKFVPQLQLPLVYADADKVREVIINLIGNALKFTHKGGVTVAASIKDDKVVTSVADTGSGIAKEDQELLFKKFSQVQGNYTRQAGGTGLGLYISKQIVEGLKGKIWLESTLGKGSTFYFTLPITH